MHTFFRLLLAIWVIGYAVLACGPLLLGAAQSGGGAAIGAVVGGAIVAVTFGPWLMIAVVLGLLVAVTRPSTVIRIEERRARRSMPVQQPGSEGRAPLPEVPRASSQTPAADPSGPARQVYIYTGRDEAEIRAKREPHAQWMRERDWVAVGEQRRRSGGLIEVRVEYGHSGSGRPS